MSTSLLELEEERELAELRAKQKERRDAEAAREAEEAARKAAEAVPKELTYTKFDALPRIIDIVERDQVGRVEWRDDTNKPRAAIIQRGKLRVTSEETALVRAEIGKDIKAAAEAAYVDAAATALGFDPGSAAFSHLGFESLCQSLKSLWGDDDSMTVLSHQRLLPVVKALRYRRSRLKVVL